ncbi:MAG: efflux transporter outer membrane subunit [Planctomycetales bacterium]|nr:efflux transporter outer membrane subunit [Planctomycetales bacterium]
MYNHNNARSAMSGEPLVIVGAVLLLSMMLGLSGCTVGPDFTKPETNVAENWSETGDPRVRTQTDVDKLWWKAFDDPTLDELIQLAYQQNLPLQIAGLRILEARARLAVAIGGQYPQQQEVFGSATGVGLSKNAANNYGSDRNFWDYQVGFDAVWELDFWGKFRRDVEAAQAGLMATEADYDDAIVTLTAEVARTYTVIRTFEVLIELASANIKVQEEGLQIADSRFRNGATTELDVTQALALLESTRASIPQLQARLQQSQNALSTLLGEPTGAFDALLSEHKGIPAAPCEVAVSMPAELLRRRPDIRSAELSAAAQCAHIGIVKADLYPSFSLFGEVGFQSSDHGGVQSGNADFGDMSDGDSFFYSFGPGIRWPIFNYGRIENNVRIQDARFQQLLVNYQGTVLRAAQEVDDALTGFLKYQEATVFEQNSVNAAQRSVEIALVQYREGAVDYQRVLDTQRALLQEENNLAQARSSLATNLIALYKALGGGWELRRGQPIIAESTQAEMQERTDWGRLIESTRKQADVETLSEDKPVLENPEQER